MANYANWPLTDSQWRYLARSLSLNVPDACCGLKNMSSTFFLFTIFVWLMVIYRQTHIYTYLCLLSNTRLLHTGQAGWSSDWLCDLIDGLEESSTSQSSWLDSSRYSSSDNFSQLCYGFQAEIPSSHAISSCTNQEHRITLHKTVQKRDGEQLLDSFVPFK